MKIRLQRRAKATREVARLERLQWLFAVLMASVPIGAAWAAHSQAGCIAVLVITALLAIGYGLNELPYGLVRTAEPKSAVDQLICLVDEYCKQGDARRLQRPWLIVSLISYAVCYAIAVSRLAAHESLDWWFAATLIAALVCMAVAGTLAEERRPEQGRKPLLQFLGGYRPLCPVNYASLTKKLVDDTWDMPDLVTFAAAEHRELLARQRQATVMAEMTVPDSER